MGAGQDEVVREATRLAASAAEPLGLEVVDVVFRRQGRFTLLRIDVDRPGPTGVTLGDCERLSRQIEALLDEAELFRDRYELQVSSPGTDRPIRSADDVRRNAGRAVVVETRDPVAGALVHHGTLGGLSGDALVLRTGDGNEVAIPWSAVARAHQDVEQDLGPASKKGRKPDGPRDRRGPIGID